MKFLLVVLFIISQVIACGSGSNLVSSGADSGVGYNSDNSGCTHVVPNGTYSMTIDSSSYPPGSVVCAETDGQVVFTGVFKPGGYDMRGFVVFSDKEKSVANGTFDRMSFVGGPACGDTVNTAAEDNTIIQNSAFYGAGGRYLFLAYQISGIQISNAIFRVDGEWGETNACNEWEPNAALNFYDTNAAVCDGCINIDQKSTAAGNSENLGGLGINAHTNGLCFSVEIRNSVDYNSSYFWAGGNGQCNTQYTNLKGNLNFNLAGTTTVSDTTGDTCNSWNENGTVITMNSDLGSGNCASTSVGVALNLDTQFLDDPRWRAEMCGGFSSRTDGWCGTQMLLSSYISQ